MHPTQVIIDWSQPSTMPVAADRQTAVATLLEWVKQYPRKGDIHVYLGTSITSRRHCGIRSTLQALGCRVTTRTPFATA